MRRVRSLQDLQAYPELEERPAARRRSREGFGQPLDPVSPWRETPGHAWLPRVEFLNRRRRQYPAVGGFLQFRPGWLWGSRRVLRGVSLQNMSDWLLWSLGQLVAHPRRVLAVLGAVTLQGLLAVLALEALRMPGVRRPRPAGAGLEDHLRSRGDGLAAGVAVGGG